MISERAFASSFSDFWQGLLPLLTPSCVHLLNAGYEEHLVGVDDMELGVVGSNEETRDTAIVSEFAYHLARIAFTEGLSVSEAFADPTFQAAAESAAFDLIKRYKGNKVFPDASLNAVELNEGLQLATRYEFFTKIHSGQKRCTFQAPIKGCGFLHACAADLVIGDYLVEIKTVKRRLAGKDIRQLITYLALSSAAKIEPWSFAGFFNPRRSTFHRFPVHEFIGLMSGGKSAVDVYAELLDFVCSSDVQIDHVF